MPTTTARYGGARVLSILALGVAVGALVIVLLTSGGGYTVKVDFQNASQLVKGDQVKVGGRPIGTITELSLDHHNQAELTLSIDDDSLTPLHEGTKAVVRSTSLSGVANRYIALAPGPNNYPRIPSGGHIPAQDTRSEVDLDAVLNAVDAGTRQDLRQIVRKSAVQYSGAEQEANAGLHALDPALSQSEQTTEEIVRDQPTLERFIVESAAVVSAIGSRSPQLEQGLAGAGATAQAVSAENTSLDSALRSAPPVLRRANTTLVDVRHALTELRPALREARPGAQPLAEVLRLLVPVSVRGRPVVRGLRQLIPETSDALRGMPALARQAVPAFGATVSSLRSALPILAGTRAYVPDVVHGILNGFGGATGGYYDANGHYARIAFEGGPYSLNASGSLVPIPSGQNTLTGFRKGVVAPCPGAATQPAPDHSNPWITPDAPCRPEETPK